MEPVNDRRKQFVAMRWQGMTYKEIGDHFNITGSWARDVVRAGCRKIKKENYFRKMRKGPSEEAKRLFALFRE